LPKSTFLAVKITHQQNLVNPENDAVYQKVVRLEIDQKHNGGG